MSFKDTLRARLAPAREKVSDLAAQHGERIGQGLDRAARSVDERTGGKYSDRIGAGTGRAKDALDRMARPSDGPATGGGGARGPEEPR